MICEAGEYADHDFTLLSRIHHAASHLHRMFWRARRAMLHAYESAVARFSKRVKYVGVMNLSCAGVDQTIYHAGEHPSHIVLPIIR